MKTLICVSVSQEQANALLEDGPRRDFVGLAQATGGELLYARSSRAKGLFGRIAGPHIRQAFRASARVRRGDTVFADGEHVGIPLVAFLSLRWRRGVRVVMLGHLVDRPWKRLLLAVTTRLGTNGSVLVHSDLQARALRGVLGKRWDFQLVPYQVDTEFWRTTEPVPVDGPILAVGAESRDYITLTNAVEGIGRDVLVAAGSHWARKQAESATLPSNVTHLSKPLGFAELRTAYERASVVVVPLQDVANQSGVTVILEAMSMGRPVVVTANRGQRECITGPLVHADGRIDAATTADRGPHLFGDARDEARTGIYAEAGSSASLRAALELALRDNGLASELSVAGRQSALAHFTFERYVQTLASVVSPPQANAAATAAFAGAQ